MFEKKYIYISFVINKISHTLLYNYFMCNCILFASINVCTIQCTLSFIIHPMQEEKFVRGKFHLIEGLSNVGRYICQLPLSAGSLLWIERGILSLLLSLFTFTRVFPSTCLLSFLYLCFINNHTSKSPSYSARTFCGNIY